jgi:hypothetical protein
MTLCAGIVYSVKFSKSLAFAFFQDECWRCIVKKWYSVWKIEAEGQNCIISANISK